MKSLISRESYRRKARYSGVYQIQGGMVTDADLDERSRITQDRTDNLGDDTIKDGVPREGGAVAIAGDGSLSLQEGVIYADGVRGVLTAKPGADLSTPLGLFSGQADFPQPVGPELPGGAEQVIYADIWDRPVFALEDPYLADPGLHGAVTGFRTRTMTQLKAAALASMPDIEAGTGKFPRIGTATLAVTPHDEELLVDDCDPCADVVSVEQTVANALWRLEIIDVVGPANDPDAITLAWSIENAAAIAPSDVDHEEFERTGKVYEFYSEITESHLGVFDDPSNAKRSAFVDDLATTPSLATDHDGQPWPFVRRWDGQAVIDTSGTGDPNDPGAPVVVSQMGDEDPISTSGKTIRLRVGSFDVALDYGGSSVVAGDYWLVELRRFAPETERIRLVKETPVGVLHHYCVLFRVDAAGQILPPTDAETRKLSFPPLSDLPASHVSFDNSCPKLYADADNVQEALDNLCDISADDVAFESNCPELYDDAKNVQDALDALCKIDFSVHGSFRLLFDWGVLCGIVPSLVKAATGLVRITAGAFLDRSGRITRFEGADVDLSKFELKKEILYDTPEEFHLALQNGKACLALAARDGGVVSVHVVPHAIAFGPDDPGFRETGLRCLEKKERISLDTTIEKQSENVKGAANKILLATSGGGVFGGTAKLTEAEAKDAGAFNDALIEEFERVATEQEAELLRLRVQKAIEDNPLGNAQGAARQVRHMQQAMAVLAAFTWSEDERLRRCVCEALFPACPPDLGDPPYFVPIACLRGGFDPQDGVSLETVCGFCCRKQAMTWRSLQYFIGDFRDMVAERLSRICCGPEKKEEEEQGEDKTDVFYDPDLYNRLELLELMEKFEVMPPSLGWPPQPPDPPLGSGIKVDVNGFSEAEAKKTLLGNGIDIAESIDINDENAFQIIESKSVGVSVTERLISAGAVRPGDKVGLLLQDGEARGYVLLERGSGKLPFPTEEAKPSVGISEADQKKAAEFIESTNAAKSELTDLVVKRVTLSEDVVNLKSEVDTLTAEQEAMAAAVKEAEALLAQLADQRAAITSEINTVNEELAAAEQSRKDIVTAVRESQPVTVVLGTKDPELVARLAGEGITNLADISGLTDDRIKTLARSDFFTEAQGREFQQAAKTFIERSL